MIAAIGISGARSAYAQTRIMPLGDSITGSPGCWRALLWNDLRTNGFTSIDFVGTLPPQGCGVPYDGDNEGHGGFLATNIADQNLLPGWLSATHPDIVMMHLGTNDVWNARSPDVILAAFSKLVDQMRAQNPNMQILVAQILPMNPSNCAECGNRVVAFNAAIPSWAAGKTTAQSPIVVVDQWTGYSTAADTTDGVHPNNTGSAPGRRCPLEPAGPLRRSRAAVEPHIPLPGIPTP
ncbi:MAG TPA: GDSL-type esterase/lipase family protein [Kofleriaceae bacterium]|nr:GDSL-type esterase/lipase family protein [Kofleriaceae bacterium]